MNPVCCKCSREMICVKNSVRVAPSDIPDYQRSGDKYQCEECGQSVVVGLGTAFASKKKADVLLIPALEDYEKARWV